MWIHDTNAPTKGLRVPGMPADADPVDIPVSDVVESGGVTRVPEAVGSALIEHCETISEHSPSE